MTALTFGTTLKGTVDVAPFARRAEELGFDLLGCGEHVMFHAPAANTFVSLSVAAGATERIKLMSTILLLPLYPRGTCPRKWGPPWMLPQTAATAWALGSAASFRKSSRPAEYQ